MIALNWTVPDDGGSVILGYIVYYKKIEEKEYIPLIGDNSTYNELSYLITYGVIEG